MRTFLRLAPLLITRAIRPADRTWRGGSDPGQAEAAAGFDYFAIEALTARLEALGEPHCGVWRGLSGWLLPLLHDPDGQEVRFYTVEKHASRKPGEVMRGPAGDRRAGPPAP
ncbi:hypothetical protein ACFW5X_11315 [Streptomyces albogriseolus]|uniref:hypothetical protein n=1 Tax=Streptomyces albogriseolus TaxID=1887 RepID=UPI0036C80C6E